MMDRAIRRIRGEHDALATVLRCLDGLVAEAERAGHAADLRLAGAVVDYLDGFLDTEHHPKEDKILFAALRQRDPGAAALIERLEAEHRQGPLLLAALRAALAACEAGADGAIAQLRSATDAYRSFQFAHMRAEEDELLPRAEQALEADDWEALDAAFAAHEDPLFGPRPGGAFAELFRRIGQISRRR